MRILKIILIILLLIPNLSFADEQLERNKITKNLRCLICQGQSVYDSDSDFTYISSVSDFIKCRGN